MNLGVFLKGHAKTWNIVVGLVKYLFALRQYL